MRFLFLFCLLSLQMLAQTDTVRVYYAIENPRYYGIEARSYFMVRGIKDAALQKKINDSISNWFSEKASLSLCRSGDPLLQQLPYATPTQRKYKCANLCATDPAYVLITHADSISLFEPAEVNPVNNAGTAVCVVNTHVFGNKLLYLGVTGGKHERIRTQNADAFFDLRSGKKINPETFIRWKKEKEDSLFRAVKNHILFEKSGSCSNCTITLTAPDSASLSPHNLVLYYRGGDAQVGFRYRISSPSGEEKTDREGTCDVPLRDIRKWLGKEYFEKLESYRK